MPRTELAGGAGLDLDNGVVVDEHLATSVPGIWAAGDVANAFHPVFGTRIRLEHWSSALNQGPVAAKNMLGQRIAYDKIPYFFSDQYDLGMEYSGYAVDWDAIVFRGDRQEREFIAFWLADGRVVAGINVNVWDVADPIAALVRSKRTVDVRQLEDPEVDLTTLAGDVSPDNVRGDRCGAGPRPTPRTDCESAGSSLAAGKLQSVLGFNDELDHDLGGRLPISHRADRLTGIQRVCLDGSDRRDGRPLWAPGLGGAERFASGDCRPEHAMGRVRPTLTERRSQHGVVRSGTDQRVNVNRVCCRFQSSDESGPDANCIGSGRQRRCHGPAGANASRSDDRQGDGRPHFIEEGQEPDAAPDVSPSLDPLGDN
jgi:Reductase C-terminal/Pyridine nucleotide-disulphide oxidoreductase